MSLAFEALEGAADFDFEMITGLVRTRPFLWLHEFLIFEIQGQASPEKHEIAAPVALAFARVPFGRSEIPDLMFR
jgi:hypothetical protein